MNTALQNHEPDLTVVPANPSVAALELAIGGDIGKLTVDDRLKYIAATCHSVGLNPLTKPFDFISFQGKVVMYANKGCAEQLRKLHSVSVEIVERKVEFGCLIVRVKATMPDGRHDEALAAVPFNEKNLPDVAMMKCETKAKRRVTLSICGLGMLDVSEVDDVREQRPSSVMEVVGESAASRVEKLNSALTEGEKDKAIEVEPVQQEQTESADPFKPLNDGLDKVNQALAEVKAPEPVKPHHPAFHNPMKPAASAPVQAPAPLQPGPPATVMDEEMIRNLEIVFSEKNTQDAVAYMVFKGKLRAGEGLEKLDLAAAKWILKNAPAFHLRVDEWVKGGRK